MNRNLLDGDTWVPSACTLPTEEHRLCAAEFDDIFARDAVGLTRPTTTQMLIEVRADPDAAARVASLAVRDTGCCSFFTFGLTISGEGVQLIVSTSPSHADVLAALGDRAELLIAGVTP